jgi:hypothetical protein
MSPFLDALGDPGRSWGQLMKREDWPFPEMLDYGKIAASLLDEPQDLERFEKLLL